MTLGATLQITKTTLINMAPTDLNATLNYVFIVARKGTVIFTKGKLTQTKMTQPKMIEMSLCCLDTGPFF